jgi:hypothetical protein
MIIPAQRIFTLQMEGRLGSAMQNGCGLQRVDKIIRLQHYLSIFGEAEEF